MLTRGTEWLNISWNNSTSSRNIFLFHCTDRKTVVFRFQGNNEKKWHANREGICSFSTSLTSWNIFNFFTNHSRNTISQTPRRGQILKYIKSVEKSLEWLEFYKKTWYQKLIVLILRRSLHHFSWNYWRKFYERCDRIFIVRRGNRVTQEKYFEMA